MDGFPKRTKWLMALCDGTDRLIGSWVSAFSKKRLPHGYSALAMYSLGSSLVQCLAREIYVRLVFKLRLSD